MNHDTQTTTQVNNYNAIFSKHTTSCTPNYQTTQFFKAEAHKIIKSNNLRSYRADILLAMADLVNADGVGIFGHQCLAKAAVCSVSTVERAVKEFKAAGFIKTYEREGWNVNKPRRERTNITVLLFAQHELPVVPVKLTDDPILDPILEVLNKEHTYDEYVIISTELENKTRERMGNAPKTSQPKTQKHISNEALNSDDPDGEVIRACIAYAFCEKDIQVAVMRMRNRDGMKNPAAFLGGMIAKMLKGEWNTDGTKAEQAERLAQEKRAIRIEQDARAKEAARIQNEKVEKYQNNLEVKKEVNKLISDIIKKLSNKPTNIN